MQCGNARLWRCHNISNDKINVYLVLELQALIIKKKNLEDSLMLSLQKKYQTWSKLSQNIGIQESMNSCADISNPRVSVSGEKSQLWYWYQNWIWFRLYTSIRFVNLLHWLFDKTKYEQIFIYREEIFGFKLFESYQLKFPQPKLY